MKIEQVAAITWTIRDHCQTVEHFQQSMHKLAAIGYQAVQVSARPPRDQMNDAEVAAACADAGLTICATHEPAASITETPEAVVETLKTLGTRYTAYPHPNGYNIDDPAELKNFIAALDHAGSVLRQAGMVLTYHNHALEFRKLDGRTHLDRIYADTDPKNLQGEIDTYWVQMGGASPIDWCQRLAGRLPLLHMKDLGIREGNTPIMHEIGYGNLDFKGIIAAAEASGCEWFIVEQDQCPGDPFESLRLSFEYIQQHLVE